MDYAIKNGVSLSTLRRHIKSNKVQYKVENGRYLLFDSTHVSSGRSNNPADLQASPRGKDENKLERELRRAQEEIAELKMLIALYEEKMSPHRLDN